MRLFFDPARRALYTYDGDRIDGVTEVDVHWEKGFGAEQCVAVIRIANLAVRPLDEADPAEVAKAAVKTQKIHDDLTAGS